MRSTNFIRVVLLIAAATALSTSARAQYSSSTNGIPQQSQQPTMPGVLNRQPDPNANPTDPGGPLDETHHARLVNDERHKKLLDDTEKLLKLAQDLRTEVEKSGKDELNVDVVKKAGEMEKLSHDIKDRMRY